THLQVAKEKHPRDWRIYQALAVVEMADNRLEEARKVLAEGMRALPEQEQAEPQATLAELLLHGGKLDEAEKIITALRTSKLPPERVRCLEARWLIEKNEWGRATALLERIRPEVSNDATFGMQVNMALGQCYRFLANPEQQLAAYTQAVELNPRNP